MDFQQRVPVVVETSQRLHHHTKPFQPRIMSRADGHRFSGFDDLGYPGQHGIRSVARPWTFPELRIRLLSGSRTPKSPSPRSA